MRTLLASALAAAALFSSASALAIERNTADMHQNRGIVVAVLDTSGPRHDDVLPAATPAPVVKDAAPAATAEPAPAGAGFVLDLGSSFNVLHGEMADGLGITGGFAVINVRIGAYVTPHVGLVTGLAAGIGTISDGCAGDCSKAYHVAIPVLVQYAFNDRARGPYLEGGLNLLPTYGATTDTDKHPEQSPESLRVSGLADMKLGFGYRFPLDGFRKGYVMDVHAGLDVGEFDSVAYTNVRGSVEGDIAEAQRALHFVASLSVGWHFAP